jgi:DNA polymerase-1
VTTTAPKEQPCEVPPFVGDPAALVLLDWSAWLHKAWALDELDMMSSVVGWLCSTLAYEPAHLAIALDSPGPTHRHRREHPTDPDWRYKGDRPPKPREFHVLSSKCTEIAEMHSIPCLWADGYEADDVIATATAKARAAGYRVWIATGDKDLHQLCEDNARDGVTVGTWDRFSRSWRGPEHVRAKWGVEPAQMADLLAIWGDTSDGVPGVPGLGCDKAAAILRAYGNLDDALSAACDPSAEAKRDKWIDSLAKQIKKAPEHERAALAEVREEQKAARAIERDRAKLVEYAAIARFSRDLTALDCDAPVDLPWEELPLGGYRTDDLRARYEALGFVRKANEVPSRRKSAPWVIPW